MIIPPTPANESERLRELQSLDLLDTEAELAFDDIVKLASHITGCPVSLISLIDKDRQWFKAKVGTEVSETPRDYAFCGHTILDDKILEIENALEDIRFNDNPLVTENPNIRFYAGQPLITSNGFRIGTLCTIDLVPRKLNDVQKEMLTSLARQASYLIEKRIHDKKQNELNKKLKITQNNIEKLFAQTEVIVAFMKGPEHRFEYVNPAHVKLLGKDATGKTIHEAQPETIEEGVLDLLNDVYLRGKTISLKNTPFRIGNSIKYFDFIYTPSYDLDGKIDGVMAVCNDITVEKDLQARLKMAIETSKVGFYEWNIVNDQIIFSDQMQSDWGIKADTKLENIVKAMHPDDQEKTYKLIKEAIDNKTKYQTEYRVIRPDGTIVWIDARGSVSYDENGQPVNFMGTSVDITEQVETRNAITKSLDNLKEERDLREGFVAALTHDLRTPLTSAKMSAQQLSAKVDKSLSSNIARIVNSMNRADNMIRDLLDVSKIKVGEKLSLGIDQTNLNTLVKNTLDELTTLHGNRFNIVSSKEVIGFWDQDILRRILENLANNAAKYGASDSPVTVAIAQEQNSVHLSVHNYGNPILEEDPMTLFEVYKRSVNIGSQKGWGIGLTLVKGFTETLGGSVKVSSSEADGTLFSITLPEDSRHFINKRS